MTNCENCHGEGLVGQGEKPWLRQGHIDTCKICNGTGKVSAGGSQAATAQTTADQSAEGEKIEGAADETNAADSGIEPAVDEITSADGAADATITEEKQQLG